MYSSCMVLCHSNNAYNAQRSKRTPKMGPKSSLPLFYFNHVRRHGLPSLTRATRCASAGLASPLHGGAYACMPGDPRDLTGGRGNDIGRPRPTSLSAGSAMSTWRHARRVSDVRLCACHLASPPSMPLLLQQAGPCACSLLAVPFCAVLRCPVPSRGMDRLSAS